MPRFLLVNHPGDGAQMNVAVDEPRRQKESCAVDPRDRGGRAGCWAGRAAGCDRGNTALMNIDFGVPERALPFRRNDSDVFDPNIVNGRGGRRLAEKCQPAHQHCKERNSRNHRDQSFQREDPGGSANRARQ
jgi:hypothetical protein